MAEDPYEILGVPRDAKPDDIRKAFRKHAKTHHPDLNPGDKAAEERFKTLSAAHELLSDPEKRAQYDRGEIDMHGQPRMDRPRYRDFAEGQQGARYSHGSTGPAGGWTEDDLGDIFGAMFGNRGRGQHSTGPIRGHDERYSLVIDFLDAVNGGTRRLTLPDGRTLDVKVPPGIEEGQSLRLREKGSVGFNGGPAGDAMIEIHIKPHPVFSREGNDIHLTLPITLREAVLGGKVTIPTPGGPVAMNVPPRSDTGQKLRLRGRGIPAHGKRTEAGDLYATLSVTTAQADAALEAFLREWTPEHEVNPRQNLMGAA